jgi:hypothetical protein
VPVPSQESELSCICVLKVSFLSLTTIFSIGFLELFRQRVWSCSDSVFGAIPTACLELFRQRVWSCSDSVFGAVPTVCLELFRHRLWSCSDSVFGAVPTVWYLFVLYLFLFLPNGKIKYSCLMHRKSMMKQCYYQ